MKILTSTFLFSLFLNAFGCGEAKKKVSFKNNENVVLECFQGIDTTKGLVALGCVGDYYAIIDSNLVVKIKRNLPIVDYNNCTNVDIDSINGQYTAELYIFKNGQANLKNLCIDIILEKEEPLRSCQAIKGQILVNYSDPTNYYGKMQPKVSIYIKELIFIDPKTKKRIEIKEKLLWKILDTGTPG